MPEWFYRDMEDGQIFSRLVERVESKDKDIKFLLSFAPKDTPENIPKGLDPTFYMTLNYDDEVKLADRIQIIRLSLQDKEGN